MSQNKYLPETDDGLLAWATPFSAKITATPTAFGVTAGNATTLSGLLSTYSTCLAASQDPQTRGPSTVFAKNQAKVNLTSFIRQLVRAIQGTLTVTNQQRQDLGITVRAEPQPIPPPATSPVVEVKSVNGSTITLRIHGEDALKRGKIPGAAGASVFSYVGENPPESTDAWVFQGSTTRTEFAVVLPQSASAQKVFLCAFWYSPRAMSGPASTPISVNLPATTSAPPGAMKMAA